MRIAPSPLDDALAPAIPAGWPPVLADRFAIAAYIEQWSVGEIDVEMVEEHFRDGVGHLRMVPVGELSQGGADTNVRVASREKRYARMDPSTMPPLLVADGLIEDGNHRFRVALKRGETHVPCYVVEFD